MLGLRLESYCELLTIQGRCTTGGKSTQIALQIIVEHHPVMSLGNELKVGGAHELTHIIPRTALRMTTE
jgi:hypothetical protein